MTCCSSAVCQAAVDSEALTRLIGEYPDSMARRRHFELHRHRTFAGRTSMQSEYQDGFSGEEYRPPSFISCFRRVEGIHGSEVEVVLQVVDASNDPCHSTLSPTGRQNHRSGAHQVSAPSGMEVQMSSLHLYACAPPRRVVQIHVISHLPAFAAAARVGRPLVRPRVGGQLTVCVVVNPLWAASPPLKLAGPHCFRPHLRLL